MRGLLRPLQQLLRTSCRDLAPLVAVVAFFQLIVIGGHFPDIGRALVGFAFVAAGLALFVKGLELGLFPLGEAMAVALARKANLLLLLAFAFALGFATTIAEPALIAVAGEAASAASRSGVIDDDAGIRDRYAMELRLTVALSVGFALVIGVIRIVKGWPIHAVIIAGYLLISVLTLFAPPEIVGIAFDSGGITTSTVTVPLVAALGIGLAQSIRGRNPLLDGFGLIAFASLTPMAFVMLFGILRGGG